MYAGAVSAVMTYDGQPWCDHQVCRAKTRTTSEASPVEDTQARSAPTIVRSAIRPGQSRSRVRTLSRGPRVAILADVPDVPAEPPLGAADGVTNRLVTDAESRVASRHWWDLDADSYVAAHGPDLGEVDVLWSPEGLRESEVRLLGPPGSLAGLSVLEIGCGTAPVARWLRTEGAHPVGLDLSAGMLGHARRLNDAAGVAVPLVQADATVLPFADGSFDLAVSAFGAVPFVASPDRLMGEVARVLRPGGRFVFSTNHPMRWVFPDDPAAESLSVRTSYFDRRAYVEFDGLRRPTYVETHRTMGDRVRDLVTAGFRVLDIVEPEWTSGRDVVWGQWSAERAALVPGTAIFVAQLPPP